jgi:hypothetical protein
VAKRRRETVAVVSDDDEADVTEPATHRTRVDSAAREHAAFERGYACAKQSTDTAALRPPHAQPGTAAPIATTAAATLVATSATATSVGAAITAALAKADADPSRFDDFAPAEDVTKCIEGRLFKLENFYDTHGVPRPKASHMFALEDGFLKHREQDNAPAITTLTRWMDCARRVRQFLTARAPAYASLWCAYCDRIIAMASELGDSVALTYDLEHRSHWSRLRWPANFAETMPERVALIAVKRATGAGGNSGSTSSGGGGAGNGSGKDRNKRGKERSATGSGPPAGSICRNFIAGKKCRWLDSAGKCKLTHTGSGSGGGSGKHGAAERKGSGGGTS